MSKHTFALYIPDPLKAGQLVMNDPLLLHRIERVLRIKKNDFLIFFNRKQHALATLHAVAKREYIFELHGVTANTPLQPTITFLLPMLKKDAFEQAYYGLVEAGANHIQPIITQKAHRRWAGESEKKRLEKICVAAAEQAKQFLFPTVEEPILLQDALDNKADCNIFFDPSGASIKTIVCENKTYSSFVLMVGPEADLDDSEKDLIHRSGFQSIALTPTILRAQQAACVGTALIRSLTNP